MPLAAGTRLGPYEILAPIGAGGMGEVYKSRDTRLDRTVAVKVSTEQFSQRFEREARAIAQLNHPNICQLYDVGPNYLVMELIEGAPLKGPLPLDQARKYAAQICDALEAAHKKGITHRDLKPANILVTASGIKLLDFGLAKIGSSRVPASDATLTMGRTEAGTVLGTAAYMSPEQAKAQDVDARSDIFSFGLVLYEMLSGRRAFARDSPIETMAAIVRDEPPPLDASSNLTAVVARCLRKLPADRFQSAAGLRAALEAAAIAKPTDKQPSIAVLPFANMSGDKENEYFSDGLAEEILNLLAKIPNLKVIARTSSFAFRGKEQDITKIAEALRVQNILEGSVRRAGSRIRVTAQLIHAADGSHLWSERYDRDMTDVFAIQDEIGQAISEALQVRLAPRTKAVNVEAYQLYLKGQYHRNRLTAESLAKAKECFEQALAIDPNYGSAYSGLAGYYSTLASAFVKPTGEVAALAKQAAQKALALDPANSEAHCVLGVVAAIFDYDWHLAETHFSKAMAATPVPLMVRFRYAQFYLHPFGRFAEAIEQMQLALDADPVSVVRHFTMASTLYSARRYREAMEYARRGLEIDANFPYNWWTLGMAQLDAGSAQDAIASFQKYVELTPWTGQSAWFLATAYRRAGDHERSEELARKLAASHGRCYLAAIYYAATGEVHAMFDALEGSYQQRERTLIEIKNERFFDPYRADPRFPSLLAKMNLM
jgi:serine/threonine-protein kinase